MSETPPMTAERRLASYGQHPETGTIDLSKLTGPQHSRINHKAGHARRGRDGAKRPAPQRQQKPQTPAETARHDETRQPPMTAQAILTAIDAPRRIRFAPAKFMSRLGRQHQRSG